MAKTGSKYYVVWKGKKPGVYSSWGECQKQVMGFDGAKYMSFPNQEQAATALRNGMGAYLGKKKTPVKPGAKNTIKGSGPVWESISVDAACSGNPGIMEYQGVYTKTGERIFYSGPYAESTNNIGEFLALVHVLAMLKKQDKRMPSTQIPKRPCRG